MYTACTDTVILHSSRPNPGVRAADETLPPIGPSLKTAKDYRQDYKTRFVAASQPVAPTPDDRAPNPEERRVAAPCSTSARAIRPQTSRRVVVGKPVTLSDDPDIAQYLLATPRPVAPVFGSDRTPLGLQDANRSIGEGDIAEPPPPLKCVAHCAYIKDFCVARHGTTRNRPGMLYTVGSATCRIGMSLSDTGAGPSIVGTSLLANLPGDACVSRTRTEPTVDDNLVGPDAKPLVTHGTVTLIFTMSGHAFRHEFLVVEGGDLLLLGNDFIGRYRATVIPFDEDEEGGMDMSVTRRGVRHRIRIPLSCAPRSQTPVAAVATIPRMEGPHHRYELHFYIQPGLDDGKDTHQKKMTMYYHETYEQRRRPGDLRLSWGVL